MPESDKNHIPVPTDSEFGKIMDRLRKFRDDRDWEQYHTPRTLTEAALIEAAEALAVFRWWVSERELTPKELAKYTEEVADFFIFGLQAADKAGIDLVAAINTKIDKNDINYPAEQVKGSAEKYTEYLEGKNEHIK